MQASDDRQHPGGDSSRPIAPVAEQEHRGRGRRWAQRTLAGVGGLLALLMVAALLLAYVWQPPEDRGYRSPYLTQVPSRSVDTPVARFHYTRTGHGPPLVLLPGGTLWIYSYREVIPQLAKQSTVFAVDLPGQGYTTLKRRHFAYDLEAMSDALGSFMDAVGLSRARKGFAHPERLTRQEVDEYWAPLSLRQNRRAMWMLQRNLHYSLTERRLGDVRAPTLVLWGGRDRFDEPWQAGELGRRIHGATVRILPGCGHMAHEDCPAQATRTLVGFLAPPAGRTAGSS
jgi:pimeloyl-ACP methyl ester carboxylesterase